MPFSSNVKFPRHMMHFSYAGQAYAGVQMNPSAKIDSVQKVIERALRHVQTVPHPFRFGVSSRTDRGVHALHNTATFDWLDEADISHQLEPLNRYLIKHQEKIRILRLHRISPQFHFRRHCLGRKYVYRLGFLKNHEFTDINRNISFLTKDKRFLLRDLTPASYNLFENDYITYVEPPYDLDAFRRGIELFQGQHNFSSFTTSQGRASMLLERRCPVKTMRLELVPGERLVPIFDSLQSHSTMQIFNVVFEAEAFLYKLIRRITGALVHLAKGEMTPEEIQQRFHSPADFYDSPYPTTLSPEGLFLYQVKYNEDDFLNPPMLSTNDATIDMGIDEVQQDDDADEFDQNVSDK